MTRITIMRQRKQTKHNTRDEIPSNKRSNRTHGAHRQETAKVKQEVTGTHTQRHRQT